VSAESIPSELEYLRSYLEQSDEDRALELLCTAAWLLDGEEKIELVQAALDSRQLSPANAKHAQELLEDLDADPQDDDNLFSQFVCDYGDIAKAIVSVKGTDLVDDLLPRFHQAGVDEEQPSWHYLDYRGTEPRGWLVHCTNEGGEIAGDGFTFGVSDLSKLGLTTRLSKLDKLEAGYNFAYEADVFDRYGWDRSGRCRYGGDIILFRAPYVDTWHYTDEEPQAIFWGPSATDIILITEASDRSYMLELEPPDDLPDDEYDYDDWTIYANSLEDLIEQIESRYEHVPRLPNPFDPEPSSRVRRRVLRG